MPVKTGINPFHMDHWMHRVYPLPPPKKKKKLAVTIVSNFSWVLQSSQEKSKTMVLHKVHYGLSENGEFTHLCLKISAFLSFQSDIKFNFYCSNLKWHSKMPLTLLGLLEPDRFKKRIFWTELGFALDWYFAHLICFLFLQLVGISKRQSYGDVRGSNFF